MGPAAAKAAREKTARLKARKAHELGPWLDRVAKSLVYADEVDNPDSYFGRHFDHMERVLKSAAHNWDDLSFRLRLKIREITSDYSVPIEDQIPLVHRAILESLPDKQ